jgi:hypothetical protein
VINGAVRGRLLTACAGLLLVAAIAARADAPETSAPPPAAPPTFAGDVAPIIYAHCTVCHRPGQSAPFALMSYDEVRKHGQTIADVTARRYMPPWHASRAEGFPEFRDERRLTDAQLSTLSEWVAAGMPSGDLKKAPLPPVFRSGWALGVPDLIVQLPRPLYVPAEGPDIYRNVTIAVDLPEDRWITALDFEPSARSVIHHALFFISPVGTAVGENEILPGLGGLNLNFGRGAGQRQTQAPPAGARGASAAEPPPAVGGIGGWVPGITPQFFPAGIAQSLPKHTNIVVQLHVHPSGKEEREDGQLALYFAKTPPARSLTSLQVPPMFGFAAGIDVPAGDKHYVIRDTFELPVDVDAYGARGHAHYLAREMKMTATLPDGTTKGLLWIKSWDFGWQDSYFYKAAFKLPKGTKIETEIIYDNSDTNPRNPNRPPKEVKWGRESFDEMGSMTLLLAAPGGADGETLRAAASQHFRDQLMKLYIGR